MNNEYTVMRKKIWKGKMIPQGKVLLVITGKVNGKKIFAGVQVEGDRSKQDAMARQIWKDMKAKHLEKHKPRL